ncbi:branched-chain amino acid ABC transporter permease [Solwaraspora sp. WMMD792]|uniref:branched-chain amino acid ABC transporter permease n=1 Tax=Solwaraspora sp. WMMD792 TaxID=3016099 RepID=UPI002416BE1C|nr:branched-chain amino acid ABC transporter permease [Solwaraspora sp. WMMD792]MDG4769869.1 branched-chain amino acid ABC transporter permease [Solwaraspora sp. WMMD792]
MSAYTLPRHLGLLAVGVLAVLATSYLLEPYRLFQAATVAAFLCATAGLTILTGLSGQLSLGHGALMAVGAYSLALSQRALAERGLTGGGALPISLLVAVLVTTALGAVIGVAAARIRGPYLAGVTLTVAIAVPALTVTFSGVFNGEQGLAVPLAPPPGVLGPYFPYERWQLWLAAAVTLLALLLLTNLVRSRYGRLLRAVRDDEVAAGLAGLPVAGIRVLAFVVSAAAAGLGGALLALLTQNVSPGAFSLALSLSLLTAVVVGGLGRLAGAAWGALLLVALPELTHSLAEALPLTPALAHRMEGNLPLAIFGLTLVLVVIVAPGGVQGHLSRLAHAAWTRLPHRAAPPTT